MLKQSWLQLFPNWRPVVSASLLVLGVGAALVALMEPYRGLIVFGLYSIPSHMLISLLPHEPVLLYYAKTYTPLAFTVAGTLGCCIAGWLDYQLLIPMLHHHQVKRRYQEVRLYQKSASLFRKWPFVALVIAGYSPLPFYPFKFLSITTQYPLRKYQLALIAGRAPRYFTLAWLGYVLQPPNWVLLLFVVMLLLISQWKKIRAVFGGWRAKRNQPDAVPGEIPPGLRLGQSVHIAKSGGESKRKGAL